MLSKRVEPRDLRALIDKAIAGLDYVRPDVLSMIERGDFRNAEAVRRMLTAIRSHVGALKQGLKLLESQDEFDEEE